MSERSDIDMRLQHAARRLREVRFEPPPLESLGIETRRVAPARQFTASRVMAGTPAMLMPLLFVVAGLLALVGAHERPVESDIPAVAISVLGAPDAVAPVAAGAPAGARAPALPDYGSPGASPAAAEAMSVDEEIALISALGTRVVGLAPDANPSAPMFRYL